MAQSSSPSNFAHRCTVGGAVWAAPFQLERRQTTPFRGKWTSMTVWALRPLVRVDRAVIAPPVTPGTTRPRGGSKSLFIPSPALLRVRRSPSTPSVLAWMGSISSFPGRPGTTFHPTPSKSPSILFPLVVVENPALDGSPGEVQRDYYSGGGAAAIGTGQLLDDLSGTAY